MVCSCIDDPMSGRSISASYPVSRATRWVLHIRVFTMPQSDASNTNNSSLITHDARLNIFRIAQGANEYVVGLYRGKWPVLVHWGRPLGDLSHYENGNEFMGKTIPAQPREFSVPAEKSVSPEFSLDRLPLEFPYGEASDFRSPAFKAYEILSDEGEAARPALEMFYDRHEIRRDLAVKVPQTEGVLPGARVPENAEAWTLEITLRDRLTCLEIVLSYTVFNTQDSVLLRNVTFVNTNKSRPIRLSPAYSFSLDIMSSSTMDGNSVAPLDVISTRGAWARESSLVRQPILSSFSTGSRAGISSHQSWPGVYICESTATESYGTCWAAALVYSGDWIISAERDEDGGVRLQGGLHPELFSWTLSPGASFSAPEAVLARSDNGLSALSQTLHIHVRSSVLPPQYAKMVKPILVNNWEATYFNFDEKKLEQIAEKAGDLGIELFVLDDGWFGKRDSDNSSLGDWVVDKRKLPNGLAALANKVGGFGVAFGLWFEPEMVSPNSELYRAHPEWCLEFQGRDQLEGRNQLILDLAIPEARDYLFDSISAVLRSANIKYVKWDHNRRFAHSGPGAYWGSMRDKRYSEYRHRHVLAAYTLMHRLTTAFPQIHWEGCAGGGGRSDYGLMSYFGTYWISDNTDAVARLEIQHGASLFLPACVMSSHVSAVPNHQNGRITTLKARTAVAMAGVLGYELDLTRMSEKEWDQVRKDVAWFKGKRHIVHDGTMFRLRSPFGCRGEGKLNEVALVFVSRDGGEALLLHYRILAVANQKDAVVRLRGLDETAKYAVEDYYGGGRRIVSGREVMHRGLVVPYKRGDGAPVVCHLKKESPEKL